MKGFLYPVQGFTVNYSFSWYIDRQKCPKISVNLTTINEAHRVRSLTAECIEHTINETPTVRGLTADNNNMQSVLMGNMETI